MGRLFFLHHLSFSASRFNLPSHRGSYGRPPIPPPPRSPPSYQGFAVFIAAVHTGHQRVMPHRFVAPLVGILQPGFQEVEACPEARQNQDGDQEVEGNEPVQEEPGHAWRGEKEA